VSRDQAAQTCADDIDFGRETGVVAGAGFVDCFDHLLTAFVKALAEADGDGDDFGVGGNAAEESLNSGGETLGSPKAADDDQRADSGRGSARMWSTALRASETVTGNEGFCGLAAQAVEEEGE